jgi:hypothetical protein
MDRVTHPTPYRHTLQCSVAITLFERYPEYYIRPELKYSLFLLSKSTILSELVGRKNILFLCSDSSLPFLTTTNVNPG